MRKMTTAILMILFFTLGLLAWVSPMSAQVRPPVDGKADVRVARQRLYDSIIEYRATRDRKLPLPNKKRPEDWTPLHQSLDMAIYPLRDLADWIIANRRD